MASAKLFKNPECIKYIKYSEKCQRTYWVRLGSST